MFLTRRGHDRCHFRHGVFDPVRDQGNTALGDRRPPNRHTDTSFGSEFIDPNSCRALPKRSRPPRRISVSHVMPIRKCCLAKKKLPGTTVVSYFSRSSL